MSVSPTAIREFAAGTKLASMELADELGAVVRTVDLVAAPGSIDLGSDVTQAILRAGAGRTSGKMALGGPNMSGMSLGWVRGSNRFEALAQSSDGRYLLQHLVPDPAASPGVATVAMGEAGMAPRVTWSHPAVEGLLFRA